MDDELVVIDESQLLLRMELTNMVPPIGSLVILKHSFGRNHPGLKGVVYDVYKGGCWVIFSNGTYQAFGCRIDSTGRRDFLKVVGFMPLKYNAEDRNVYNDLRAGVFAKCFKKIESIVKC